ncbi:hypothetical protein RchiOBHm_Chr1g0322731 [Rosa chinensis]|uniref:Uncharacterized protein n=1 Tax=Rosa chinensis TaxID=74649 RepID=A0A2P6S9C8_ROSCH|nr:hypothetical protein RchiOBHm_Chr1g0322731 [Rosa chinensis]
MIFLLSIILHIYWRILEIANPALFTIWVEKNARKVEMKLLPKFGDHRRSWPPHEQWRRVNSAARE